MTTFQTILVAIVVLILGAALLRRAWTVAIVYPWEAALLYRDGVFRRQLKPGRHVFLDPNRRVNIARLSAGELLASFGQIDVITADQFAFRIHVSLFYRLIDARAAYEAQIVLGYGDPAGLRDRTGAAALAVVGTKALEAAISEPAAIAAEIVAALDGQTPHIEVTSALLTKIELPPETRRMLTDAERARREGLAALERARGEQASMRALANAARLVRDNPELASLRLLKTIESAKGPTTIVLGDPRAAPPS